jgi:hypothetical protein
MREILIVMHQKKVVMLVELQERTVMRSIINSIVFVLVVVVMIVFPVITTIGAYASTTTANEDYTEEERESGFYNERGGVKPENDRSAINPAFDPDEDCNFAYELHCVPGTEQECPEGWDNGEDNVCSPDGCEEGYVEADEEEHGPCNITYEECESGSYADNDYILIKDDSRCALGYFVCIEPEHREKDYCIEYCDENPEKDACDSQEREKRDANAALWCDGNPRGIGDDFLAQLPKLDDDKCFGTCEMPNGQLVCDVEKKDN